MNVEQRAEAMYKMSPEQRAETMAQMNPSLRKSFLAPNAGRMVAGAAGMSALAAMGMHSRTTQFEGGKGAQRVPRVPSFANPRQVEGFGQHEAVISSQPSAPLAWRGDALNLPRAGNARTGNPGAVDPGGYIRNPGVVSPLINPGFARQQFAAFMPNYAALASANAANMVANPAAWPWTLPAYAPGWFNSWNGPWSWANNWYDNGWGWGGGPYPSWDLGYGGYGGIWSFLANLLPWGLNSNDGWVPYLHYYSGYSWDGSTYPQNYYASNGFVPTRYVFDVATGQFWAPGVGYVDYLPPDYTAPITVAMQESVPMYDTSGQIDGYKMETFDYNGFWDANAQAYGFYDYRQQFHYLTFPWLSSWEGSYIEE
jgi:hypothetical protein